MVIESAQHRSAVLLRDDFRARFVAEVDVSDGRVEIFYGDVSITVKKASSATEYYSIYTGDRI
jgi:hypothetical protein